MKLNTKQLTVDDLKHLVKEGNRVATKTYEDNECGRASACEIRLAVFIGDLLDVLDTIIVEAELADEKESIPEWATPVSKISSGPMKYLMEVRNYYPDAYMADNSYGDVALYTFWSKKAGVDAFAQYKDGEFSWREGFDPNAQPVRNLVFPDTVDVLQWVRSYHPDAWCSDISMAEFAPVIFWVDKEQEGRTAAIARYQRGIFNWLEEYRPSDSEQSYNWTGKTAVDATLYQGKDYSNIEFVAAAAGVDASAVQLESVQETVHDDGVTVRESTYYINKEIRSAESGVAGAVVASIH